MIMGQLQLHTIVHPLYQNPLKMLRKILQSMYWPTKKKPVLSCNRHSSALHLTLYFLYSFLAFFFFFFWGKYFSFVFFFFFFSFKNITIAANQTRNMNSTFLSWSPQKPTLDILLRREPCLYNGMSWPSSLESYNGKHKGSLHLILSTVEEKKIRVIDLKQS